MYKGLQRCSQPATQPSSSKLKTNFFSSKSKKEYMSPFSNQSKKERTREDMKDGFYNSFAFQSQIHFSIFSKRLNMHKN
jgi:hypothetical protein